MSRTLKNESIDKMLNLLGRIDNNYKMLTETKMLMEDKEIVKNVYYDPGQFLDFLESLKDTTIINIAIVQAGDLDLPKVKRKNPATNRMKTYNDYSSFNMEGQEDVAAIAKVTRYNIMYRKQNELNREYGEHKKKLSDLNVKYGLNPIGSRESYKEKTGYGDEAHIYKGNNQEKQGTLYMAINTARVMGKDPEAKYYLIDANGRLVGKDKLDKDNNPIGTKEPMSDELLSQYPQKRKGNSYVEALRRMGKDETIVKQYIEELKALGPMKYRNPTFDHILWCCATPQDGGEASIFVNKNLSRNIDGVDIDAASFESIVKGIYSYSEAELNNMTQQSNPAIGESRKRPLRLTESDLRDMIRETINSVLNEDMSRQEIWQMVKSGHYSRIPQTSYAMSVIRGFLDNGQITSREYDRIMQSIGRGYRLGNGMDLY